MNNRNKRAGQSTRGMAEKRYKSKAGFVLFMAVLAFAILILLIKPNILGIGGLGFLALFFLFLVITGYMDIGTKNMERGERRAIRGAEAEEQIGSNLDDLGEDYLIIHDVASPYGNIDHIVIGKNNGVFLIETKAHGGRISIVDQRLLVNGHEPEKDFIAQTLQNTYWLREELYHALGVKIWITPILVFTNAFVERTAPIKGVLIINKKYLLNILQRPNSKAYNLLIWKSQEKILEALTD